MTLGKQTLWDNEGKDVLSYLREERGISEQIIDQLNFGYIPERVNHEWKNRIITPIYDAYNRLIFLSSRVPRTKDFMHESINKSFYLFGIQAAKKNIIKYGKAIVVEGEFDVAFLHSYGINVAVGICGTAMGLYQLSLLARYCSEIYYITDGDKAGQQSRERVMKLSDEHSLKTLGVDIIPIILPDKKDPDDFIKENGKDAFVQLLKETKYKMNKKSELDG